MIFSFLAYFRCTSTLCTTYYPGWGQLVSAPNCFRAENSIFRHPKTPDQKLLKIGTQTFLGRKLKLFGTKKFQVEIPIISAPKIPSRKSCYFRHPTYWVLNNFRPRHSILQPKIGLCNDPAPLPPVLYSSVRRPNTSVLNRLLCNENKDRCML